MTVKEILQKYKHKLDSSELEYLLALALHKNRQYLYKNPDKKLSRSTQLTLTKLIRKRLTNWSIAYLARHKEFYGLNFLVSKHTLIPRPESEIIVDEALRFLKNKIKQRVLDVGTGSGNIIISIAKNYSHADYLASDISKKALVTARTNARKHGLKNQIKFVYADLLTNISKQKFNVITANLPYLTEQQMSEPSIGREPRVALLSGQNGLDHYRKLLEQLPKYLNKKYLILLEIDPAQKDGIKKIIKKNLPQAKVVVIKDLAGLDRVVKIY